MYCSDWGDETEEDENLIPWPVATSVWNRWDIRSIVPSRDVPFPFSSPCGHRYIRYQKIYSVILPSGCCWIASRVCKECIDNRYQPPLVSFPSSSETGVFCYDQFHRHSSRRKERHANLQRLRPWRIKCHRISPGSISFCSSHIHYPHLRVREKQSF